MGPTALLEMEVNEDLNPYVGQLTNKLMLSVLGHDGRVQPDDWAVISEVLNFAAEAEQRLISQRRRISQLEELSMTDDLTGLANRRGLDDFMIRTISAARRYREHGVVAYIDLDNFKAVNDSHGHDAGDDVLRQVATRLIQKTRSSDLVVRLGGDEFVVVLTRCDPAQGKTRALKLESILNRMVIEYDSVDIPVEASVGAEPFGARSLFADVLRRADQQMLAKKRQKSQDRTAAASH